MIVMPVVALLVYTFGAFAYGAILLLWIREWGRARWASVPCVPDQRQALDTASVFLFLVSFLWFVTNLGLVLLELGPPVRVWRVELFAMWLALAFPPLIMHMMTNEVRQTRTAPLRPVWRRVLGAAYVVALLLASGSTLAFHGVGGFPSGTVALAVSLAICSTFVGSAVFSIALTTAEAPKAIDARARQSRRWWMGLFVLMIPMFVVLIAFNTLAPSIVWPARLVEVAVKSLPLVFMFVGTYFENRFEFFDLFVKRGLALVATIAVLAVAFAATLPVLRRYDDVAAAPWVYTILLLPVVTALPWLHARIASGLDRYWLGRRFSTVDAVTRFLAGLRSATTETQLVSSAQDGLGEIFSAPVIVRTAAHADGPAPFEVVQEIPARLGDDVVGWFLMGRRTSEAPYFSEDIVLLRSLADVFASVLHNLRLQMREQDQERRARELSLHASRSELKALRAQINPHFLFNALNAIAGLIPREPAVADRTIEKLAEVFRYALRGADCEWAILDDELEFVRAYLDVEHARFGARLQTGVRLTDDVREARVPTMVVQTLVENAVKHGAAAVRGRALVEVDARREGGRVHVVVSDNGPGLDAESRAETDARRGGYGLANIRQRLDGYFGSEAALTIERDAVRGLTIATLELPYLAREPQSKAAAVAGGRS
ncbi:MAG TPA: histidine kinase [Vicinamibacterales bacterium]|nr:histidine kinase [Vicinamibacterales bacterium]